MGSVALECISHVNGTGLDVRLRKDETSWMQNLVARFDKTWLDDVSLDLSPLE